eukprot:NODE_413_length_7912_cov_0.917061.p8 type:complete len:156 gc:universal NODE_413_length_7912_cov_0.917061:4772-4305(-)
MSEVQADDRKIDYTIGREDSTPKPLHTIYIKNLGPEVRAKDLGELFEKFGRLIRCDVPEPRPGQSPFAFVEFENSSDAHQALTEMQGYDLQEHKLELAWAKNRTGRARGRFPRGSRFGRGYGGGRGGYRPYGGRGGGYDGDNYGSPYARGPCKSI